MRQDQGIIFYSAIYVLIDLFIAQFSQESKQTNTNNPPDPRRFVTIKVTLQNLQKFSFCSFQFFFPKGIPIAAIE